MAILQRGFHELRLFAPGVVIGALFLRLGRFCQDRAEGRSSVPSKNPAKSGEAATRWKGIGLIFTGALAVDAWWNYGVVTAVVVTFVFLAEIRIVMRWRRHRD